MDKSSTIAEILLLFTSAPINFCINSDDVSMAILVIFSGAVFLSLLISSSAFLISSSICLSKISFFVLISLRAFSLAWLKIFLASFLLFNIISSYSLSLDILPSLCLSAASILSEICDFLNSKLALIFGSISFDKAKYKIPKVIVNQNIWEIQNSGFNWGIPPLSAAKTFPIKKKLKNTIWKNIFLIIYN